MPAIDAKPPTAWCAAQVHVGTGRRGAFMMGICRAAYCVGGGRMLMALSFAGGVVNLVWTAVLALIVFFAKVARQGRGFRQLTDVLLIVWAIVTLLVWRR
jgi:predicted metal-binding membrane protein